MKENLYMRVLHRFDGMVIHDGDVRTYSKLYVVLADTQLNREIAEKRLHPLFSSK